MGYRTVFDLADNGFPFWPYVYVSAGLILVTGFNLLRKSRRGERTRVAKWFLAMAIVVALVAAVIPAWDYHRLSGRLARGETLVAEGEVSGHFVDTTRTRVPDSGKNSSWQMRTSTWEGFRVGDTEFGYHRGMTHVGFLNGDDPPLEISDGMRMRLTYVIDALGGHHEQRILRVEVGAAP
jgi:hypothetical protein